jgi:hypothetical protein
MSLATSNHNTFEVNYPKDLHPNTADLVLNMSEALAEKLLRAQQKYGYSNEWADPSWMDKCREDLRAHLEKGDPLDVIAYAAFLWYHDASTIKKENEIYE